MAKIVTRDQRIVTGGTNPQAFYSRVVSCSEAVSSAADRFTYTTIVGERVWLLGVKLFWQPMALDPTAAVNFRVMTGTTKPGSADQMRQNWTNVLPVLLWRDTDVDWTCDYGRDEMSWTMRQLYTGQGRRFGVWMRIAAAGKVHSCQASFEISEG